MGDVAVVICSRDRAALLREALAAVQEVLQPGDELVVVDSGSRDESVLAVARAAQVSCVRVNVPGLSRARNAGWRATTAPVVLFTDDDCRPDPGWRDAGRTALAEDRVGAVWGTVRAGSGTDGGLDLLADHGGAAEATLETDLMLVGHGASMAFRRQVLEELGGFDEELGVGAPLASAEDKDMLWRALRQGWRVCAAPRMAVSHVRWRGDREALAQMVRYGVGAGAFAAKRRRVAGDRGVVRRELWHHGVVPAARAARHARPRLVAAALLRTAGFLMGYARARRLPLHDDRYAGGPQPAPTPGPPR